MCRVKLVSESDYDYSFFAGRDDNYGGDDGDFGGGGDW